MSKRSIRNHVPKKTFLDSLENACQVLFGLVTFLFLLVFVLSLLALCVAVPIEVFSQL